MPLPFPRHDRCRVYCTAGPLSVEGNVCVGEGGGK